MVGSATEASECCRSRGRHSKLEGEEERDQYLVLGSILGPCKNAYGVSWVLLVGKSKMKVRMVSINEDLKILFIILPF